jgi:hypothetical protein
MRQKYFGSGRMHNIANRHDSEKSMIEFRECKDDTTDLRNTARAGRVAQVVEHLPSKAS